MQTTFISNLFTYTMKNEKQLSFPNSTFFMYKLMKDNGKSNETDWVGSMYFTFQVNNFNITKLQFNNGTSSAETGIMLVESIQNFKTYFSQIVMDTEFDVDVNFTRMYCNDPICPTDNKYGFVSSNSMLIRFLGKISRHYFYKPIECIHELANESRSEFRQNEAQ
jgi:hypothetical protein